MDPFGFSGLLPVVFGGCEGSKIVVCEARGFSAGDAFADLEVARPDYKRTIGVVVAGDVVGCGWLPVG